MSTSKAEGVVVAVDGNMLLVALGELMNSLLDVFHPTLFPHRLGRHVGVEARAVPVTTIYGISDYLYVVVVVVL